MDNGNNFVKYLLAMKEYFIEKLQATKSNKDKEGVNVFDFN